MITILLSWDNGIREEKIVATQDEAKAYIDENQEAGFIVCADNPHDEMDIINHYK